jgi:preprotein translocase subunit YajC
MVKRRLAMFLFNSFVFFTLAAVVLVSFVLVRRHKAEMTVMNGMITSMFLGMNIGLTGGILFGSVFRGDLFLSTILSIVIGAAVGILLGGLFNVAAAIEGLMSGIMGGMMGAMLGEMLLPEKSLILINIFLTISIAALFLFKILTQEKSLIKSKKYLLKPFFIFIFLLIYLFFGSKLAGNFIIDLPLIKEHDQHLHHP